MSDVTPVGPDGGHRYAGETTEQPETAVTSWPESHSSDSMGTASYVLAGSSGADAFHSTCHGAGRTMSRTAARATS